MTALARFADQNRPFPRVPEGKPGLVFAGICVCLGGFIMKRIALMALASGLAIAAATPANATITIAYSLNGGTTITQLATDAATPGSAGYVGTTQNYFFNVGGTGAPITSPFDLLTQSINIQSNAARANSLIVYVTDSNLTSINGGTLMSSFTSNVLSPGTTATISSLYSSTNALYTGTPLQSFNYTSIGSNTGLNTITAASPFSLTVRYDITFGANGNFNGTGNITAVPEPATWGMMIVGFGLLGGVMRRRKTTVAFA